MSDSTFEASYTSSYRLVNYDSDSITFRYGDRLVSIIGMTFMTTREQQNHNALKAKLRHDVRSRFSIFIGLLDIMSDDPHWSPQRRVIVDAKHSVEKCLEEILTAIESLASVSADKVKTDFFAAVRTIALPCLKKLTEHSSWTPPEVHCESDWLETLENEIRQFELWLSQDQSEQNTSSPSQIKSEPPHMDDHAMAGEKKIFAIDDESHNLDLVQMFLKKESWRVVCFTSGEKALKALQVSQCDLILLDLNLDGLSGIELLVTLKSMPLTRSIPVVMMTGSEDSEALEACQHAGAVSILSKPFGKRQLIELLQSILPK
jgi:CheY-like chemotaxis protein